MHPCPFQVEAARKLKEKLEGAGKSLVPLQGGNLVDAVWGEARPPAPDTRLRVHPLEFAGVPVADKLAALRAKLGGARPAASHPFVQKRCDPCCWEDTPGNAMQGLV